MLTLLVSLLACAPAVTGDPVTGKILYDDNCAACHAADGTGGAGPNIVGAATSRIEDVVANGNGDMPAFSSFSAQDLADVAAYVTQDL